MKPPPSASASQASANWPRLKALFQGALEQPAEAREQWLRAAAGGDLALLHEAQALLDAYEGVGHFLEEPPLIDPADLVDDLAPGTTIGSYTIVEELGRGGMGVVYLAEDRRLSRRVAIKVLPPPAAMDPAFRERLRREARAAATISHPGVAVVYALEEIGDRLFIVSEYVRGRTLREEIERAPIADHRAVAIAMEIAAALAAAHDAGVIHRDLKPDNVLLAQTGTSNASEPGTGSDPASRIPDPESRIPHPGSGTVKIVDFGIAHMEGVDVTRLTREGAVIGTPAFMAPEQFTGGPSDARADIYAAGVLMAAMVKGRTSALASIIDRCLQHDPAARFQSARELHHALQLIRSPIADVHVPRSGSRWWWEFHQAMAALTYWLMVIPVWSARGLIGGLPGRMVFIVTLAAVIVAANLRLHLWFTSRFYPSELKWLRARVGRWIHAADWVFAATLVLAALLLGDERSALAVLLLSFGIGAAVAFLVIEPATTRAAFRK
jgi:predicted Ser/Thr protein kinase